MRTTIETPRDEQNIRGKFVLQVNSHQPDKTLMDMDWGFAKEKRVKFMTQLGYADLYGNITTFEDFESYKDWFNKYLLHRMKAEGKEDGGRFNRLLTSKELEYLFAKLKEENY